jgi:hypothetical protein
MKRIVTLIFAFVFFIHSQAASVPVSSTKPVNAAEVFLPVGKNGEKISLLQLSEIKIKDLEQLTGQHMKTADKIGFKIAQRQLRQSINEDGTINNKRMSKALAKADGAGGFHLGGFALGFLLFIIGVLIAYLINDDKKAQRVKWAWIGFGVVLVIYLLAAVL